MALGVLYESGNFNCCPCGALSYLMDSAIELCMLGGIFGPSFLRRAHGKRKEILADWAGIGCFDAMDFFILPR